MKNIYNILLFLFIPTFIIAQGSIEEPSIGDGSAANPYEISTYGHLRWISETDQNVTPTWSLHYIQTDDIDAIDSNSGLGFVPIATSIQGGLANTFSGTYNGNNHSISNLFINRNENFVGLFSSIIGEIFDLEIINADITGSSNSGILAGEVGTIAGVTGSINNVTVTGGTMFGIGGTNGSTENIGGLIGTLRNGLISNSSSSADVTGNIRVGGLVGGFFDPTNTNGLIEKSFATGNVVGNDQVGGFIGRQLNAVNTIRNCYARGSVSGISNVGGFIGNLVAGNVENSYAANTVSITSGSETPAGFGNENGAGIAIACFYDSNLTSSDNSSATGETTPTMQDEDTFITAGWDFVCETTNGTEDIWSINAGVNNSYPNLEGVDDIFIEAIEPDGDGSTENPYLITSLGNLYWMTTTPTSWDANFEQINDIDASPTAEWGCNNEGWIPIGINDATNFTGVYEGSGFEISGLTINADIPNAGFFDILAGEVNNLKFDNADFEGEFTNAGILAGQITTGADVFRVYVLEGNSLNVPFSFLPPSPPSNMGGLAGFMNGGTVSQSYANANLTNVQGLTGGFLGQIANGEINNSYSRANVTTVVDVAGGFVGEISGGIIDKTYSASSLNSDFGATLNPYGNQTGGTVTNSFYDSDILANDDSDAVGEPNSAMTEEGIFLAAGWDFVCETENGTEDIWRIATSTNANYPFFNDEIDEVVLLPEGAGTEADPYQITSLANLIWVAQNPAEWGAFYIQLNNIDVSESLDFTCPGEEEFQIIAQGELESFSGNYDGQNFSIENLTLDEDDDRIGFFGTLAGATIQNLNFTTSSIVGNSNLGVLAGIITSNSTIENISIQGNVAQNEELNLENIGGLAGAIGDSNLSAITIDINIISEGLQTGGVAGSVDNSTLTDISVAGNIAGNNQLGGVIGIGQNNTSIENASVTATISATNNSENLGGIVGQLNNSSVANSSLSTAINLPTINNLGGIVGSSQDAEINNNTTSANITGADFVGGIVGEAIEGDINNNSNQGEINAENNVGGIVGNNNQATIFENLNANEINGIDFVGGIAGSSINGILTGNENQQRVFGTNDVGGIVGSSTSSNLINNQNSNEISGTNRIGGIVGNFIGGNLVSNTNNSNSSIGGSGEDAGGLVGLLSGEPSQVSQNSNLADVSGNNNSGGLFGRLTGTVNLTEQNVQGIVVKGSQRVGGLIGVLEVGASISESFTSNITIDSDNITRTGGFVGHNEGTISRSYVNNLNFLEINSDLNNAGGFVGFMENGLIEDSYVLSTATNVFNESNNNNPSIAGGFVGNAAGGEITRAYVAVNSDENGFTGTGTGTTITNSFYDEELAEGDSDSSATATTTENMQLETTFTAADWDFECEDANGSEYIWGINTEDNQEYPFLTWQGFESECRFDANWNGNISEDWADAENWDENEIPAAEASIFVPDSVPNFPTLDTSRVIGALQLQGDATLTLNNHQLTIQGNIVGSGSFIGSKESSIELTTGGSVSFRMNQDTEEETNILGQLIIDRDGREITNLDQTYIADFLRVDGGEFITGDRFTFYCDWDNLKVGLIDQLGSDASVSGTVTTEQCFPARRAFRFITPPLNMTATIRDSWQEGAASWDDSPQNGYGTHITGLGTPNATPTNDGLNGFDWQPSGNPSLFSWSGNSWNAVSSTLQTPNSGQARRLMIRGDRTIDITSNATEPTPTKLRTIGSLRQGNLTDEPSPLNEDDLVFRGNPFQSFLDLREVLTQSSGFKNYVYYWNPNLGGANPIPGEPGGRGAWVAYWLDENDDFETIAFSNDDNSTETLSGPSSIYLQPMQAVMFVADDTSSNTLRLNEAFVTANPSENQNQAFSTGNKEITISLFKATDFNNESTFADQIKLAFNASYEQTNSVPKMTNLDENLGIQMGNELYMGIRRNLPDHEEQISLFLNQQITDEYVFSINLNQFDDYDVYLKDNYLDELTLLEDGNSTVSFNVDASINASSAFNRFELIFEDSNMNTDSFDANQISLYPNPMKGNQVEIDLGQLFINQAEINIFNNLGKQVMHRKVEIDTQRVQLNGLHLSSGLYHVQLKSEAGDVFTAKLIVE